jgi:glutamate dehydrogenase
VPDAEIAQPFLTKYFPTQMQKAYGEHLRLHPLRREIIATAAVNYVINYAGVGFVFRIQGLTNCDVGDVVQAYLIADRDSKAEETRQRLRDKGLPVAEEHAQLVQIEQALEQAALGLLRNEHVDLATALNGVA